LQIGKPKKKESGGREEKTPLKKNRWTQEKGERTAKELEEQHHALKTGLDVTPPSQTRGVRQRVWGKERFLGERARTTANPNFRRNWGEEEQERKGSHERGSSKRRETASVPRGET